MISGQKWLSGKYCPVVKSKNRYKTLLTLTSIYAANDCGVSESLSLGAVNCENIRKLVAGPGSSRLERPGFSLLQVSSLGEHERSSQSLCSLIFDWRLWCSIFSLLLHLYSKITLNITTSVNDTHAPTDAYKIVCSFLWGVWLSSIS